MNLATGESKEVPFFPPELNRSIGVRYAKPESGTTWRDVSRVAGVMVRAWVQRTQIK
jgi:hypothetical protein